jgi:hypothetical protein
MAQIFLGPLLNTEKVLCVLAVDQAKQGKDCCEALMVCATVEKHAASIAFALIAL